MLLPPVSKYVDPDGAPGPTNIGLHVDTHGALTGPKTPDRESHHTTQYLLAEYFRHEKDDEPFEDGAPGLVMEGKKPARLLGPGREVDFKGLADGTGRGINMPAILIANLTHRRGKLHINSAEPDERKSGDDPDYGGSTQGALFHSWWRASQGPAKRQAEQDRNGAPLPTPVTTGLKPGSEKYAEATKDQAAHLVHAVDSTYGRMRSHMLPALSRALHEHESAYYMALARRRHGVDDDDAVPKSYRMTNAHLDRAYGRARQNNDEKMKDYGFEKHD
jgi:hypothetical protein